MIDAQAFRDEAAAILFERMALLRRFVEPASLPSVIQHAALLRRIDAFADQLVRDEPSAWAAGELVEALYGRNELPPPSFWRSEVGRAVAVAIGYPEPWCPSATAAHILGVTRGRIWQLVRAGQLTPRPEDQHQYRNKVKYVSAESVRARLRHVLTPRPGVS